MSDDILETMMRKRREVKKSDQENQPEQKRTKDKKKSKKILDEVELQTNTLKSDNDDESQHTETDKNDITSILTMKHRNTSKELSKQVDNIDPNNIVEEIHNVKDRMKEKLKYISKDEPTEAETKLNLDKDTTASKIESETEAGLSTARSRPTSSSEIESKRKRLERRIKKDQGVKEALQQTYQEENERSYRVLNSFRKRDRTTRFDTDIETDEQRTERLDTTARKGFRNLVDSVVTNELRPATVDDKYDFFCKKWDDPEDTEEVNTRETKIEKKPSTEEGTEPLQTDVEAQIDEKSKLLDTFKDDDGRSSVYVKPTYVPHEEQKTLEGKHYFVANANDVPLKRKLGEQVEAPRYLEEEGYYVGKKPYVTRANKNRMEDRLTRDPTTASKWFGLDGELVRLSDPIKYIATRPSVPVTFDPLIETEFKHPIQSNFNIEKIDGTTESSLGKYRIDIDVNQIEFTYHHLFSEEHVLAFKLKSLVKHFKISEEQCLVQILTQKLKALKDAESSLKKSLGPLTSRSQAVISREKDQKELNDIKRLNAYKVEIQNTRQERDKEMRINKSLIDNIIQTWKAIKELRSKKGFRTTDIKLIIKKKNTDRIAEEDELRREIRDEFEDRKQIVQEEYEKALNEFNEKNKVWKLQKTRKKEAEKRNEQRKEETQDTKLIALLNETKERDELTLLEEDLPKPEKPVDIKDEQIRSEIEQKYNEIYKTPGDPILSFELVNEMNISPVEQCSETEKIRRDVLQKTKIYVKILLNGKLLNATSKIPLSNEFTVYWGQIFNAYMIYWPKSIKFEIWESIGSKDTKISEEINLPIPQLTSTSSNIDLEKYEFASQNEYFMQSELDKALKRFMQSGVLTAGAAWGIDKDGQVLAPPRVDTTNYLSKMLKNYDAITALGVSRMQDANQLAKWIMKSNLDPNDPRNSDLINLIKTLSGLDRMSNINVIDNLDLPTWFRLDQLISEFNFLADDDQLKKFESSKRFKLIELRSHEEPEFKNYKMIPLNENQIPNELIKSFEERRVKEKSFDSTTKYENEIEIYRLKGRKLVQKIRETIFKRFRFAQHKKTLADMIVEETIPNLTVLGSLFWSLYIEPRRPLYPSRRERKKITGQNVISEEVYIVLTIGSAYDLPIRKEKSSIDPLKVVLDSLIGKNTKVHEKINGESLINPYVEVSFQKSSFRTIIGDGPNSTWNQEIKLKLKAPNNDYTPSSLQTCTDSIYINVYDEIEVDILQDDRERDNVIHKQIQRNWIGGVKIPFSSIYFNSRIEGTFKLDVPPLLLGYSRDPKLSKVKTYAAIENLFNYEKPNIEASYLSIYATIEPSLLVPEPFSQTFDSNENYEILELSSQWCTQLAKKFPNREFQTTVMDSQGKSVFITRYFKGLRPPEELIEGGSDLSFETAQNVARFVYLIPYVSDTLLFPGLCDIWNTCDQFIESLAGDDEEHAVLLTNLFLGLGKKAWLVIGSSITGGSSAFCLSEENAELNVWFKGKPYKVKEAYNPIRRISMIVNAENIWANTQQYDEPFRMFFDLTNTRHWSPFFSKSTVQNQFQSIQPDRINFVQTNQKSVKDLESKIEAKLKDMISKWRSKHTRWNRNASTALRHILPKLEAFRGETINTEPEELHQILNSYTMCGFPINLPYTDINSILDAVYATQIHNVPSNDVEFALAVHIHAYPNTVLSVWIYVVTLTRRK